LRARNRFCFTARGVVAYAENVQKEISMHYFGEEFDSENGDGADMDDNVRNPKQN
jgi:ATP-dependent DNA helicase RecQ